MKNKKAFSSTPADRAMELLNDPKWSWNRFPDKQINYISYNLNKFFDRLKFPIVKYILVKYEIGWVDHCNHVRSPDVFTYPLPPCPTCGA